MDKSTLNKANELSQRIKDLGLLKHYLDPENAVHVGWRHDLFRKLIPKRIYQKLYNDNIREFERGNDKFDKEFAEDVIEFLDKLIDKYNNELAHL